VLQLVTPLIQNGNFEAARENINKYLDHSKNTIAAMPEMSK
jgi:Tfp pilus assembly protein PilF